MKFQVIVFQFIILIISPLLHAGPQSSSGKGTIRIRIDPQEAGRTFEGIGAVSAGASSELLIDYPEPIRSDILDYLFKPKFGASLQQLKVEIGADAVVVGSEPTHARSPRELYHPQEKYYRRGYEFWLMNEARMRNPEIVLSALEWAIPAYLGGHWTQANADYIVQFIKGARDYWGIDMQYISPGKNESKISTAWLKDIFKPSLDRAGLSNIKILAPDNLGYYWEICKEMATDPELESIVDAVGYHYVFQHLPDMGHEEFAATGTAKSLDASLWASEDWSAHDGSWENAHLLAGILNKMYIRDRITAMQIWCPVDGYYDNTGEWKSTGLMKTDQPWTGYYEVSPAIWAVAHFTQFTGIGWEYIDPACGYLDSPSGGNYTTLVSPDRKDYTVVFYTDTIPGQIEVDCMPGTENREHYLWRSNRQDQFIRVQSIKPGKGKISLELEPGSIYTLSTLTGQSKGLTQIPDSAGFPIPYYDDFNEERPGYSPRYLADIQGCFELTKGEIPGEQWLEQKTPVEPIDWTFFYAFKPLDPLTQLGDINWEDYEVSVEVMLPDTGSARLIIRMGELPVYTLGYVLKLDHKGYWELLLNSHQILGSGKIPDPGTRWHTLKLACQGSRVEAYIDGSLLKRVEDGNVKKGLVGLGCSWHNVRFDNLFIQEYVQNPR